jgi:hypothetical protein
MKEKRDRLFRVSRPHIRPLELLNGETYGKDMAILWAAYKLGSFGERIEQGLDQKAFANLFITISSGYNLGWIIEDKNKQFKEGQGPIGLILAVYNGWELEPHFEKFQWASARNILKSFVSFLQMMRYDKTVGIVNVYSLKSSKNLFDHVCQYGVLRFAAKIPKGDVRGDRYIYYTHGKRK